MFILHVPKNTEKRLKLAVFWIFWVKKTKIRKKILWSTCKYDLLVIGEAFWGSWEQWTQSKYQKTAKNSVFGHKKLRQIAPVKNQPQRPLLPFSRVHLGPTCKIPARQKIFFFRPLKREIFAGVTFDRCAFTKKFDKKFSPFVTDICVFLTFNRMSWKMFWFVWFVCRLLPTPESLPLT